jgi:hypothetical protein
MGVHGHTDSRAFVPDETVPGVGIGLVAHHEEQGLLATPDPWFSLNHVLAHELPEGHDWTAIRRPSRALFSAGSRESPFGRYLMVQASGSSLTASST